MNRLFISGVVMLITIASFGQDISKREADSLSKSLDAAHTSDDRLNILFKLAQYHMFKPGEYPVDLDSAKVCIEKAAALNAQIKSAEAAGFLLLLNSLLFREKGQIKDGKAMAENAVVLLKNGRNNYYLGKAYFALSDYFDYNNPNQNTEKIQLVERAYKAFRDAEDKERQAFTLTFLADLYQLNNERPKAIRKLDTAVELYNSIGHKSLQSVYALYATIYYSEDLFRQSLKYGLLALQCAETARDSTMTLCQINNYIGRTLNNLKESDKAIGYFQQAYEIAKKENDKGAALLMVTNIVQTYFKQRKARNALSFLQTVPDSILKQDSELSFIYIPFCYLLIYTDLKRFAEAQHYAGEILQLINQHKPGPVHLINFYYALANYYFESGKYASARMYINKVDSLNSFMADITRDRANYSLKFRLDTTLQNYKSAVANLLAFQKLKDSVFNETSNKQIKQLEVEYETEKNKSEIAVLNQKNQLSQNRLDREKLIKKFTVGAIALLCIIIALLFRQYRHKQHTNSVIVYKNDQLQHLLTEKEWLVKEIHHRVKNNFHIVASLLEIQSGYLKNKEALSAIKESQDRIHSMSIIHQKLYQTEALSTIQMPAYIYELVEHLRESYAIRESIRFSVQIESIDLNHASATTLGLILNEAITNAIKYAFAETDEGKIAISLTHISDSQILLSIADNGRGLPTDFASRTGTSMGMDLLQGLSDDLGGSFEIENDHGTHIRVIFNYKAVANTSTSSI